MPEPIHRPEHDFDGLERHLELVNALEPIFVGASHFEERFKDRLRPAAQGFLRHAIQDLAVVYESLVNLPVAQTEHTPECLKRQALFGEALAVFTRHYPHYCRGCGGWGGGAYWESPAPGPGTIPAWDGCPACEDNPDLPICALCGQILSEEGARLCACPRQGLPAQPECVCWDETLRTGDNAWRSP